MVNEGYELEIIFKRVFLRWYGGKNIDGFLGNVLVWVIVMFLCYINWFGWGIILKD